MTKFDQVDTLFANVPYMRRFEAEILREIMVEEQLESILEIGFFQGKSSTYIAAMLEDFGGDGHLVTFDLASARRHVPNIEDLLEKANLSHRVTPVFCKRSYTWDLQRLISSPNRPQFDFCYFDGGHTWDMTGLGVLLVDMLLRPGGLLLLDDMDWSMSASRNYKENPDQLRKYDDDEIAAKPVRLAWDTILMHLGYTQVREYPEAHWGLARKPL